MMCWKKRGMPWSFPESFSYINVTVDTEVSLQGVRYSESQYEGNRR